MNIMKYASLLGITILFTTWIQADPSSDLLEAAEARNYKATIAAISNGADVNSLDRYGRSALAWAAGNCNNKAGEYLISKGADVNLQIDYEEHKSILMLACEKRCSTLVKILIEKGANINAKDNAGNTAFFYGLRSGSKSIIDAFLSSDSANHSSSITNGIKPLEFVVDIIPKGPESSQLYLNVLRFLLDKGADPNISKSPTWTPLLIASQSGYAKAVELLLLKGATVNCRTEYGKTPLMFAACCGKEAQRMVALLLQHKADINATAQDGRTALYEATECTDTGVVKLLLKAGADPNLRTDYGRTPLIALLSGSANRGPSEPILKIAKALVDAGADLNTPDKYGYTPLIWAVRSGIEKDREIVDCLLSKGADINQKDKEGKTALAWAIWANDNIMAEHLRKAGGN